MTPFSLEERLLHVKEAERVLGSRIPWLCDTMKNRVKAAFGGAPNAEIVTDPRGRVVGRRAWSSPEALREDLARLVGPVAAPTRPEDLDLPAIRPAPVVKTGVVPRIEVPSGMRPLRVAPDRKHADHAFYVKLRAEATEGVLEGGAGTLYLGFRLDPLYHVHWNNEVRPLSFEIDTPRGVRLEPSAGSAPEADEPADADPREFLLQLRAERTRKPLDLTVRYFACDDANTFCVPVTQRYAVHLEWDPDGGRVLRGGRGGMGVEDMVAFMMDMDRDGDGRLSEDEATGPLKARFGSMDANRDGFLDRDEMRAVAEMFGASRSSDDGPRDDGGR